MTILGLRASGLCHHCLTLPRQSRSSHGHRAGRAAGSDCVLTLFTKRDGLEVLVCQPFPPGHGFHRRSRETPKGRPRKKKERQWSKTDMDLMTNIPYWLLNTRRPSRNNHH